jgi:hypothetical protein
VGVQNPLDHRPLEARLARWLDHRLRETAPPSAAVQLFGLEVIDEERIDDLDDTAVRTVFVCDGRDERAVLDHPDAWRAFDFDAVALVRHGWVLVPPASVRPGAPPRRERGVTISVAARP